MIGDHRFKPLEWAKETVIWQVTAKELQEERLSVPSADSHSALELDSAWDDFCDSDS